MNILNKNTIEKLKMYKNEIVESLKVFPQLKDYSERMDKCFETVYTVKGECGKQHHVHYNICKLRYCPICGQLRRNHLVGKYKESVKEMGNPVMLTLTVPNVKHISKKYIRELTEKLKRLRRTKLFKDNVLGGFYSIELKYSKKRKEFHPHIHLLLDLKIKHTPDNLFRLINFNITERFHRSTLPFYNWFKSNHIKDLNKSIPENIELKFMDVITGGSYFERQEKQKGQVKVFEALFQLSITSVWYDYTGGYICNVKRVDDNGIMEIFKYITKITDFSNDAKLLLDFIRAIDGTRLLQAFGSMYGKNQTEKEIEVEIENEVEKNILYASKIKIKKSAYGQKYVSFKCQNCKRGGCSARINSEIKENLLKEINAIDKALNFYHELNIYTPDDVKKTFKRIFPKRLRSAINNLKYKLERDTFLGRDRDSSFYLTKLWKYTESRLNRCLAESLLEKEFENIKDVDDIDVFEEKIKNLENGVLPFEKIRCEIE